VTYANKGVEPAIGGDDGMEVSTQPFCDAGPGIGRELQVDARTQSDVRGMDDEAASDDIDNSGYQVVTGVSTIGSEIRSGGWEKNTVPTGATPRRNFTSGSRGAADIGKL